MKRIRCPKCDERITFDESLYVPGRMLVFECPECRKQFKIRITNNNTPNGQEQEQEELPVYGYLTIIENAFHYRQTILLHEGKNVIGRHVRGTKANAAIKTVDPSVDTTHCIIEVKLYKKKKTTFILRDGPSGTGTFLQNEILREKDRIFIEDGAIITIGATTMILHKGKPLDEKESSDNR